MKTFLPSKKVIAKISILIAFLVTATSANTQVLEMVFRTVTLESGIAGEDGAQYRFTNVASGLDAIIEIKGRSSSSVVISSIDTVAADMGYDKAFQPVIGIPGTAPANTTWSMDFSLTFYRAGTNIKVSLPIFKVTGLDIDGDGTSLSEWTQMKKLKKIDSAVVNSLTFTNMGSSGSGDDYKVDGVVATSPGIDTTAINVMATYTYEHKNGFDFSIGAKTNGSTTTAGMRFNSLWFRDFFNPLLPVTMMSFTAILNNENKAELKWATATEENASHFEVEKSFDGKNYSLAAVVLANGNTTDKMNYSYTDDVSKSLANIIYYRLRTVDIDGKAEFSAVRIIKLKTEPGKSISILTYPNPVSNEVRITIPASWQNKKVIYEMYNAAGKMAKRMEAASSSQTEIVNVGNLSPGFYIVRVSFDGQTAQQKIIKQ